MCRWFAYISKEQEILLEDALVFPDHSLAKQVVDRYLPGLAEHEPCATEADTTKEIALRNRYYNADGLGVAWYDNTRERFRLIGGRRPTVYKIVSQPLTDPNFLSICRNTASTAVFAHIRAASPGTAITPWNAHPFHFGRYTLMHNGDFAYWDRIKIMMCKEMSYDAYNQILGSTDSEHFAALFFTILEEVTKGKRGRTRDSEVPKTVEEGHDPDDKEPVDFDLGGTRVGDCVLGDAKLGDFNSDVLGWLRIGDQKLRHLDKPLGDVQNVTVDTVDDILPVWEHRHSLQDLKLAMERTIQHIIAFQVEAAKVENGGIPIELQTLRASNINIVISDGYQLLAIRCRNHATEHPPSLYVSRQAGPYLNRAFVGNPDDDTPFNPFILNLMSLYLLPFESYKKHFVICSEPTTFNENDWKLVEKNTGVMVDEDMNETWFDVDMGY